MFCGYSCEQLILILCSAALLLWTCSWVTSINHRFAPHFSHNLCTCIRLISVILINVWENKANKHIILQMLTKSFWHLPCGIFTGYDIVSCGFSSAAQWYVWQTGSVNWVRVLRVNKWEALEFFLVQVGYKLLIWGGQLWGVACEKAIKVLSVTPTLRWREREREMERGRWRENGMNMMAWGRSRKNGHQTDKEEKKRKTTKTWHQPIKSVTAKTVDFHWSLW